MNFYPFTVYSGFFDQSGRKRFCKSIPEVPNTNKISSIYDLTAKTSSSKYIGDSDPTNLIFNGKKCCDLCGRKTNILSVRDLPERNKSSSLFVYFEALSQQLNKHKTENDNELKS